MAISGQHGSPLTMSQKNSHKPNAALRDSNENLSQDLGTFLEFQRLQACPYSAGGMGLIPGCWTKIPRALQCGQKKPTQQTPITGQFTTRRCGSTAHATPPLCSLTSAGLISFYKPGNCGLEQASSRGRAWTNLVLKSVLTSTTADNWCLQGS